MPPGIIKQSTHRPGPLKQSNKPHKNGSKGKKNDKGRVDVKTASIRKMQQLSRTERKNQLNQLRKRKREEILKQKGRFGGINASPILVTILSLNGSIDPTKLLDDLKSCDEDLIISQSSLGHCHISCPRLKQRFTFLIPQVSDIHSVMDALKVSEILLLLHSSSDHSDDVDLLLSIIIGHALPTTLHVVKGMDKFNVKKKADFRKQILKNIEARFPDAKLHPADSRQDLQLLIRQIGSQKQRSMGFRDNRPHLIAEDVKFEQSDLSSGKGTLQVLGYVRGQPFNVNGLVHIPGWDTFQMCSIFQFDDPRAIQKGLMNGLNICEDADPHLQESLQSEVIPDPMEGEQTWPTQEELEEADLRPKKTVRKVAEGISDYQASWIVDVDDGSDYSDDESYSDDQMSDDNKEDLEENMDDTESVATNMKDENYDKNLDMDEERQTLVRFKEERANQMFPDEQDTPIDVTARTRYQRYRGLKNFKTAPWDVMENLPEEYARIYRFQNFRQTKKKVLKVEKNGFEPGTYVKLHISNVPKALYDSISENSIFVVYGLLQHEQKMSVVNTAIRKQASCKVPIKSKDTLIFHVGFRRFTCKPIFSEHTAGNKFKYERFLPSDGVVIASFFAPVTFPPASVVVFRQRQSGIHELVATGSVVDVNPNRVVVKRVVLSGHPFRITRKVAVVRYMFFNKDDINWFKCLELRTKCGRRGHIREALGSHGHMKCVFDEQLQSQDVVLMSLYKRVFPKWTYDSYVPTPVCEPSIQDSTLHNTLTNQTNKLLTNLNSTESSVEEMLL